ncbi:SDR family NAD(P)-dependent oxidoreductase [Janibacter sp. RAF20_2_2]|uniref:SDR family NAD(P)-dependent oxidoreductase n=1 Tax=unclassified Janibacter TaxID=2649294 RepID=UPI003F938E44
MSAETHRWPAGAVVTGAGRGLGRQIAGLLVERGYRVLVTDLDEAAAQQVARELGERATALALDVRDDAAVRAARDRIIAVAVDWTSGSTTPACSSPAPRGSTTSSSAA